MKPKKTIRQTRRKRGGRNEKEIRKIVSQFSLVERSYSDIFDTLLDDVMDGLKEFMTDCCQIEGKISANSFFTGLTNDGTNIILVSKKADSDLLKELELLPEPRNVYIFDDNINFEVNENWDYSTDYGDEITRTFKLSGVSDIEGLNHNVEFIIHAQDGNTGKGKMDFFTIPHNTEKEPDVIIIKSELYTPQGNMLDIFKMSDDTKKEIEEAVREANQGFNKHADKLMREYENEMNDNDYFGGRNKRRSIRKSRRHHKKSGKKGGKKSIRKTRRNKRH